MARPRTFDEDAVLTAAMHAFRREGYARASVQHLEEATGLRASSLYNAYGDKAGLFRRALDHYVDTFVQPRLTAYAGAESTLEDLEVLYLTLFAAPLTDGYGCLVTNSAIELGPDPIGTRVSDTLDAVSTHVDGVLRRELGSADEGAGLELLYHGLLVLSRARALTDVHEASVRHHFARLRALREESR